MKPDQEPKYEAVGEFYEERIAGQGQHHRVVAHLVNRATGQPIPDDEPVFVFRARDRHAIKALKFYRDQCANQDHRDVVDDRITDFAKFAVMHPERMKEPDSPA